MPEKRKPLKNTRKAVRRSVTPSRRVSIDESTNDARRDRGTGAVATRATRTEKHGTTTGRFRSRSSSLLERRGIVRGARNELYSFVKSGSMTARAHRVRLARRSIPAKRPPPRFPAAAEGASHGAGSAFAFSASRCAAASRASGSSSPGLGSFLNSVSTG